jgi:hypothetical protein
VLTEQERSSAADILPEPERFRPAALGSRELSVEVDTDIGLPAKKTLTRAPAFRKKVNRVTVVQ